VPVRRLRLHDAHTVAHLTARADARRLGRPVPDDPAAPDASHHQAVARWERDIAAVDGIALGWFGADRLEAAVLVVPARADNGRGDVISGWAHLSLLATDPEHWGRGLASRLLDHTEVRVAEQGHQLVELWTQRDNLRARRLYERRGWIRSRRLPALNEHGETMVHYQRTLPALLLGRAFVADP